jgi:hypothetical protein
MELILGLPAMNQFDLAATPMRNCFSEKPDFSPYQVAANQVPLALFNENLERLSPQARFWAEESLKIPMYAPGLKSEENDQTLNRILWSATHADAAPYPEKYAKMSGEDKD